MARFGGLLAFKLTSGIAGVVAIAIATGERIIGQGGLQLPQPQPQLYLWRRWALYRYMVAAAPEHAG